MRSLDFRTPMCRFATLLLAFACTLPTQAQPRVVGYYPSWARGAYPHTAVRYDLLTHIAHAFIWPNADGSLLTDGHWTAYPEMVQAAHAQGVKVVIAVGGYDLTLTPNFARVAANPALRAAFVTNLVRFVKTHGYDGVDLDWEYPKAADRANVTALVQELREALTAADATYTLSLALPASNWAGGYDVRAIQPSVDWFGIMTYDYHGGWTAHAGHVAPLYHPASDAEGSASQSVTLWLNEGMLPAKLHFGIPLYGYRFTSTGLYQPRTGATPSITYWAADALRASGWTYTWDTTARVPYLQNPARTELVTYEDTTSAQGKVAFVQARGLGGVILWALHHDYDPAQPGKGQPLLESIGTRLLASTTETDDAPELGSLRLLPARPTPFRAATTIPFELPRATNVRLRVFDVRGAEVARLVDGVVPVGPHTATWHADGLPAGLYLCRLETDAASHTRVLVLTP